MLAISTKTSGFRSLESDWNSIQGACKPEGKAATTCVAAGIKVASGLQLATGITGGHRSSDPSLWSCSVPVDRGSGVVGPIEAFAVPQGMLVLDILGGSSHRAKGIEF